MKKNGIVLLILAFIGSALVASSLINTNQKTPELEVDSLKIKGVSFVAPPRPFSSNPMIALEKVNVEWIAVIPYGFIPSDGHQVRHGSKRQWWGEREEGVVETIRNAKEHNLKIMLKPQIWMSGSWIGDFELHSEKEWSAWEESYTDYIMLYARIAAEYDVDMICIGTEFKKAMKANSEYWYELIAEIRTVYDGPLTYSSNWDEYMDVPIWDKLDYIGISAYFPLTDQLNPSHKELQKKWAPTIRALETFSKKKKKKIIFTEFGYLSLDRCAGQTWVLEKERDKHNENQEAQADALHCLFESFWEKEFWAGGFLWKWYPEISERRKGFHNKDYSPQGKIAEKTLANWYDKK